MRAPTDRIEIYYKKEECLERQNAILDGKAYKYLGKQQAGWKGSARNRELILQFQEHLVGKGTKQYRIAKITLHLRKLCDLLSTDLDMATRQDLKKIVTTIITSKAWAPETQRDYKRILKHFYKWFEQEDPRLIVPILPYNPERPPTAQELQAHALAQENAQTTQKLYHYLRTDVDTKKPRRSVGRVQIISDADCLHLIRNGCRLPMERALVATLHNAGGRVDEVLNLRICDYTRKGKHAAILLDGKTGERPVLLLQAIPWIEQWLEYHPYAKDPNSPLWVSTHPLHYGKPIRYAGIRCLIRRVCERANYKGRSNPHWWRHSRATIDAPLYSEAVRNEMMGWQQGSSQSKIYTHLTAENIEAAFLQVHGLTESQDVKPVTQYCKVCRETNTSDARYCFRCGNALTVQVLVEDEKQKSAATNEAFEYLTDMLTNPTLSAEFHSFLAQKAKEAKK